MIILVTGSRDWTDGALIERKLVEYGATEVIQGGAAGADWCAKWACRRLGIPCHQENAKWNTYGHAAGPIRNRVMLNMQPDLVLAFHPDLSQSKGTADCVQEARHRRMWVIHVRAAELDVVEYGHDNHGRHQARPEIAQVDDGR